MSLQDSGASKPSPLPYPAGTISSYRNTTFELPRFRVKNATLQPEKTSLIASVETTNASLVTLLQTRFQ